MLGLIKKDLLMIKGNMRQVLLFLIVFLILALQENNIIVIVPVFVSMMVFITTFSYDEYNKWDAYAITLPISRKDIVKSKYITSVILWLIALLVTVVIVGIMGIFEQNIDYFEMFGMILGCALSIVLLEAVMFPLIFKFGVERTRILMMAVIFIPVFAIVAGIQYLPETVIAFMVQNVNLMVALAVALSILLYIGSYFMSLGIFSKKEF